MVAAPPSCRAATNVAPCATSALVTWKLPLPTTPNTLSTPSPASSAPTASATVLLNVRPCSTLDQGEHARGAARTAHDRQWRRDQHRALRRQAVQVAQLGQAVLAGAEQERVTGERRIEALRGAGVGADPPP